MLHINIHPENAISIPGLGHEQELAKIVNNYFSKCQSLPERLNSLSWEPIHLSDTIDLAYEYIHDRAFDGDIEAEIALRDMEDILNTRSFPNYFAVQEERNLNTRLAKQGEIYSMAMLGDRYYRGKGFKQNYYKAFEWYMKAAELGVKQAQYNVGGCYEMGRGIEKNMVKAIYWYTKAAEQGLEAAKRNLVRIELQKSNTQEDITSYLPTYVWEGERDTAIKDEFGVEYSADGKRLLWAPDNLKEYTIKDGTQVICNCAFAMCEELSHITIPEGVLVIGGFCNCEKLETIQIPNSTREILGYAFKGSGLKSIIIPDNVTILGNCAFMDCTNLESITIGKNIQNIEDETFMWCERLKHIEVTAGNKRYDSRDKCNAIIETETNTIVVGSNNTIIPNTITSIGDKAFWGRRVMNTLTVPGNVKTIGNNAFFRCDKLEEIVIKNGVKKIGAESFFECENIKSVTLSETLEEIGAYAFRDCDSIKNINFPNSLKTIGEFAFAGCGEITELPLPDSITRIEDHAFSGCANVTSLSIPKGIKNIAYSSFNGLYKLTKITIPDGIRIIGPYAFAGCENLEKPDIPASVKLIATNAFDKTEDLRWRCYR